MLLPVPGDLLYAQESRIELADKYFDRFDYEKAIQLYEGAIRKKEFAILKKRPNWRIYAKLADAYYNTSRPDMAAKNYGIAYEKNSDLSSSYLRKYVISLQSSGASAEDINKIRLAYLEISEDYSNIPRSGTDVTFSEIENLTLINSEKSEFGALIHENILYFSSSRINENKPNRFNKRLYKWNKQPFLDIYRATIDRDTDSIKLIEEDSTLVNINSYSHESGISLTADGKNMVYAGGMVKKNGHPDYNKNGTSTLKLYMAELKNDIWEKTEFDFIENELYSFGGPAFGLNDNWLFFVSCAPFPEAKGQTDIYAVELKNGKPIGDIINLPINTPANESFPFISADSTLYFSSDRIQEDNLNLGMMDIYRVKDVYKAIKERKATIEHLGAEINSTKDDFAFFIDESYPLGDSEYYAYFSSNREFDNAKGDDDMYRIKVNLSSDIPLIIGGTIFDKVTKNPLAGATITLIDSDGINLKTIEVDSSGTFSFEVESNHIYNIHGSKTYYFDDLRSYNSSMKSDGINLELEPFPCEIINPIGFETNSDVISSQEIENLKPIIDLLKAHPEIKIKIESHTDFVGSDTSNQDLSNRRALNTKQHFIDNEVQPGQILSAIGYGEKCPIYSEENIKNSTPDEQKIKNARNRRSRFVLNICTDESGPCIGPDSN